MGQMKRKRPKHLEGEEPVRRTFGGVGAPANENLDRCSVRFQVMYEQGGEAAVAVDAAPFDYNPFNNGQPFNRRLRVDETFVPLETGWVTAPVFLVLQNKTGLNRQIKPTKAEIEEDMKAIVEIRLGDSDDAPIIPVRRGRVAIFELPQNASVFIRSQAGIAAVSIDAFPA